MGAGAGAGGGALTAISAPKADPHTANAKAPAAIEMMRLLIGAPERYVGLRVIAIGTGHNSPVPKKGHSRRFPASVAVLPHRQKMSVRPCKPADVACGSLAAAAAKGVGVRFTPKSCRDSCLTARSVWATSRLMLRNGRIRKTASRRSVRNRIRCFVQAAAKVVAVFRLLRQPNKPNAPRPEAKSGKAAGSGVVPVLPLMVGKT